MITMTKITESQIEQFAIELLEKQGYQYIYAPSIAPDSYTPERQSFEDVLLMERLQTAVSRINPSIPADIREDAIKQIQRLNSPELIANIFETGEFEKKAALSILKTVQKEELTI